LARITQTSQAIDWMIRYLLPFCTDQSTVLELRDMAPVPERWREAHKLFRRIRKKTLAADDAGDLRLQHQYSFEEICAKTLYNMADHSKGFSSEYLPPFDSDVPLWVVRIAIGFARFVGASDFERIATEHAPLFQVTEV
jgi:hypothetical protein